MSSASHGKNEAKRALVCLALLSSLRDHYLGLGAREYSVQSKAATGCIHAGQKVVAFNRSSLDESAVLYQKRDRMRPRWNRSCKPNMTAISAFGIISIKEPIGREQTMVDVAGGADPVVTGGLKRLYRGRKR